MQNVVLFPDIDFINHHTHDAKGHYRYGRGYQDLVMDTFKADINGADYTPHYIEHDEFVNASSVICTPQGVGVWRGGEAVERGSDHHRHEQVLHR